MSNSGLARPKSKGGLKHGLYVPMKPNMTPISCPTDGGGAYFVSPAISLVV